MIPRSLVTCTTSASRSVPLARHGLGFRVHRALPSLILQSGTLSPRAYAPNVRYPTVGLALLGHLHEPGYARRESKAAAPASGRPLLFHFNACGHPSLLPLSGCPRCWIFSRVPLLLSFCHLRQLLKPALSSSRQQ